MISIVRELRLIPIVLFAIVCLFSLKMLGLFFDGSYTLADLDFRGGSAAASAPPVKAAAPPKDDATRKQPWAWTWTRLGSYEDVTGSAAASKPAEKPPDKPKPAEPEQKPQGQVVPLDGPKTVSPAERALLERLQERRQELEARARELEIRESLLRSAEKQMEARLGELKDLEARIKTASQQKDEAEAAKLKSLVVMYENMKAKDAARIFDRLEMKILLDVASQINPRRMSDILAQMQSESAEKLTVEMANRATGAEKSPSPNDLPKIEGRPPAR
jgi:flagellar motility protein MotE (MotC chaperone)